MTNDDLMRLYAKLNAQDILINTCISSIIHLTSEPPHMLETMRMAAMELADKQQLRPGEPNPEFGKESQLRTLQMIADLFDRMKAKPPRGESGMEK